MMFKDLEDDVVFNTKKETIKMSEQVSGVIEKTSFKMVPTKFGDKPNKGFFVNGEWYGGFVTDKNRGDMEAAGEGDIVTIYFDQNGKYKNLTGVVVTAKNGNAAPAAPTKSVSKEVATSVQNLNDKDRRITYLASRRDAIEFVKAAIQMELLPLPTKKAEKADVFHEYVKEYANRFVDDAYGISVAAVAKESKKKETTDGE